MARQASHGYVFVRITECETALPKGNMYHPVY